jgi:hypothetical protein
MKCAFQIILCFWSVVISAQISNINIDADYDSVAFLDFVNDMEREYSIKFYFNKSWLNTVIVNQTHLPTNLATILDDSFDDLGLNYLIDGPNVLITNNYKITTTLDENFFTIENNTGKKYSDTIDLKHAFIERVSKKEQKSDNGHINIGNPANRFIGDRAVVSGIIRNEEDGEPIIGAVVYVKELNIGTITDMYGCYVITLPKGNHEILFKYVGRKDTRVPVVVNEDGLLDVNMEENLVQLREVVITSDKENNVKNLNVGMMALDIEVIKQLPTTMGEVDIIKSALLLPGIQTVGEGSSGFNVRGGSAEQNLILFDGAPIFNSSHLFGFFSVFNPEVIKDFKLYKSGIPARYGGRISSVLDVTAKQGNRKKYSVSGGISPITGKLTVEGPIIKNKASFIIGGRSTYSDWILQRLDKPQFKNSNASFYDISAKLTYDINDKNSINIMGYRSEDNFKLNADSAYHYENRCFSLLFKRSLSRKIYGTISAIYSNYQYNISSDKEPAISFNLKYNIEYKSLKTEFFYFPNSSHNINIGAEVIRYNMTPSDFTPLLPESDIMEMKLPMEQGIESGLFVNDEITVNNRLTISAGLRYASFLVLGPGRVYEYRTDAPRSVESRTDSTVYNTDKIIKAYGGPEVRLTIRYKTGLNNSVKLSYNRIYQFLHMLTNSTSISPTDIWKISDAHIKPLIGNQIALGYYQNFLSNTVESSVEVYYKYTKNHLDYKSGTELILNPDLEVDLLAGIGRAYGMELFVKKKYGRLNGWVSYTYSRSELKVNGKFTDEKINLGEFYPASYDKPHDITLVANYKYSRRFSISNNFTYSTGRPISYPVAKYNFRGRELIHYSNRNEYRIPDYLRWDVSINIEGNLKSHKLAHSSWTFGVYNVTGRENVYSVFFKTSKGGVKGYKLSVFARPIFNVTYNFRF